MAWSGGGTRAGGRKSSADKTDEPLSLAGAPKAGAKRCEWFAKTYIKTPSGKGARSQFRVRPWQRKILQGVFPSRGKRPRQALVELARGQGKSTLACVLALYAAFADEVESPEVLLVAANERQAERLLLKMWRMIQLDDRLMNRCELYKSANRIEIGFNGGTIMALPSRFDALQGYDPTFVILDEAHVVDQEVYDALVTSLAKRPTSCLLTISTPGDSQETLLWRLVQHARSGDDPDLVYVTFEAPPGCDPWDKAAWKEANPALGDFLHMDGLESAARSMLPHRENQFRRLHLCQWSGSEDHWIPWGVWDGRAVRERVVLPDTPICVGFDGSWTRDATALIGVTVPQFEDELPHLFVLGLWEHDRPGWRVPLDEVTEAVSYAFRTFDVVEMVVDKAHWRSEVERWRLEFGETRIIDMPQSAQRMVPATDRLYQAVMDGTVTHDGHDGLSRHMHNAVAVEKPGGVQIHKPKNAPAKDSPVGRIDAAVASIMAFDSACMAAGRGPEDAPLVFAY